MAKHDVWSHLQTYVVKTWKTDMVGTVETEEHLTGLDLASDLLRILLAWFVSRLQEVSA